jgi:hypothetical protein
VLALLQRRFAVHPLLPRRFGASDQRQRPMLAARLAPSPSPSPGR